MQQYDDTNSVSFYPQVISNFKRKSTVGLSPDFVVLNVIGFACYTAYNAAFYWNHSIQEMYKERFGPGAEITVQSNDVAFAIHALVLSVITLVQILYYSTTASGSTVRLSRPVLFVILGISILCAGYPLLVVLGPHSAPGYYDGDSNTMGKFNWLDFLYLLSYIKIFISTIKYIPQVFLNIRRKSTVGWSIWNILLDLTGGTLSDLQVSKQVLEIDAMNRGVNVVTHICFCFVAFTLTFQLVLDCADMKDFSGITHNKAKLALGSLSIVFDLIFLAQHYCLYPGAITTENEEQREPLLQPSVEENNRTANEGDDEDETSSGPRTIFV